MLFDTDIAPTVPFPEVHFLGTFAKDFGFDEEGWNQVGTVRATKTDMAGREWTYSTEINTEIDPNTEGFWMWGDVLVHVTPMTILESELCVYRKREEDDG